jgi:AraC family transcriptional regulator of adaptative response / DNA-3-methyladenine glycosylase II
MVSDALDGGIEEIANQLGVTSRQLRRSFEQEYGVAPVRFLLTLRLLMAKALLTDTELAITDIAFAAGFGSIRRFNETFHKHYRMAPSHFRQQLESRIGQRDTMPDAITVLTGYRGPLDWEWLLGFIGARTIAGIDAVSEGSYRRAVRLVNDGKVCSGHIAVSPADGKDALAVNVSTSLLPVLPAVLMRVRALFDLDCEPSAVHDHLRVMDEVVPGSNTLGVRVPGAFDSFEMAVRAILGQQVTVKAARTLANRMAETLGESVENPVAGLTRVFPSAETIAALPGPVEDALGPLGVTGSRARAIRALAEAVATGAIELSPSAEVAVTMERLLALPGIGPWTAHYLAMRALAWPDAFPHTDYGVKLAFTQALGPGADVSPKRILEIAEAWKPWRAYATMNLWRSLS